MNDQYINNILENYEFSSEREMIYELLPRGYNIPAAYAEISKLKEFPEGTQITTFGYIDKYETTPFGTKLNKIKAKLYKDGDHIYLTWIASKAKTSTFIYGLEQKSKNKSLVQVSGKIKIYEFKGGGEFRFIDAPQLNSVTKATDGSNAMFIVPEPLYKLKPNIKVSQIQLAFRRVLENWDQLDKSELLPIELEQYLGLHTLYESIQNCHGLKPINSKDLTSFLEYNGFRKRLTAEKIWKIVKTGMGVKNTAINAEAQIDDQDIDFVKEALLALPFTLTNDQKKAIWGAMKEFSKRKGSKTLVFGDVGSGKTMVALVLAYMLLKNGKQVAILTPTSILAKHYEEAIRLLPKEEIAIVHSKSTSREKTAINKKLASGKPMIVYGTTSVNSLDFTNLALAVIDEEQKFGVKDKEKLFDRFGCHLMFMTATPIPRTLANVMFSDFEVMKIEEKPAMQKPRITKIAQLQELDLDEINGIRGRMKNGEQTLVIVPSIVSDEMMSVSKAIEKYSYYFPGFKIGSINGKMKPDLVEKVTESFMKGEIDILIATTMVDSGFSNNRLSHVFVESAERFGIAQLHQIRGRVGRGSLQGYCYLSNNSRNETSEARLLSVASSENGFELSMKDIEIRGSGNLTGDEQSGFETDFLEWSKEIKVMQNYLSQ